MPELPEVEVVRRRLLTCLPGLVVRDVRVHDATVCDLPEDELRRTIAGRRVLGLRRRGKYLMIDLG
ncbi:MAG TPA: DNA-formamidopyrimidine glycosylase family protein, partial [Thermoleophilia bacterium]|nr:DNA-formamidopyrimidine glycosylase family protein [Thermoleophilia bacterium]